ncbi:MAG: hemin uptake protein HemP [Pseudomonadota bacterium]
MTMIPKKIEAPQMSALKSFDARDLMGDDQEVEIMLDHTRYVLRLTRAGKLILNK